MSIDSLKELSVSFQSARKKFLDEAKEALTPALSEVFTKHPEIEKYGWVQYVPYFNDGEPCEFSVGDVQYKEFSEEENESEDEDDEDSMYDWEYCYDKKYKALDAVASFISKNEELVEEIFGTHAKVIVSREGVEVLDYSDHD